jgi:hypothetical protein
MANEIVKKHIIDEVYNYSISYDADLDCGQIAGMKLTGGIPTEYNGEKCVRFETKFKGQIIQVRYASRPDLAALVDEYNRIQAELAKEREARWAEEKAKQEAIDRPLLEEMERKAAELRAQIPEDHIEVTITKTGDSDGWPILDYEADGVKLSWEDVNMLGSACAIRPGAMGAFAEVWIGSIAKNKLEEIRLNQQKKAAEKQVKREEWARERNETPIPPEALAAYRKYHGDAEKAWENEDETAWAMIRKWTPYIETQYGIDPIKLQKEVSEAVREANYGINEG